MNAPILPVTSADIDAAARVIAPYAVRTPLLSPPVLCERMATRVFLKPEMLQRTGSFKFRGAFNKLSSIPMEKRGGGVVAFSSGNHAQGVAHAAQLLGMQATIVMPIDAPLSKRERTKAYRRRGRAVRPRPRGPRSHRRRHRRRSAAPRWCGPMTIPS